MYISKYTYRYRYRYRYRYIPPEGAIEETGDKRLIELKLEFSSAPLSLKQKEDMVLGDLRVSFIGAIKIDERVFIIDDSMFIYTSYRLCAYVCLHLYCKYIALKYNI